MELQEAREILAGLKANSLKLGNHEKGQISQLYYLLKQNDALLSKSKDLDDFLKRLQREAKKLDGLELSFTKRELQKIIDEGSSKFNKSYEDNVTVLRKIENEKQEFLNTYIKMREEKIFMISLKSFIIGVATTLILLRMHQVGLENGWF